MKVEPPKKEKPKEAGKLAAGEAEEKAAGPTPRLAEKFVLDPAFVALFASDDDKAAPPRGVAVKYIRVTSKLWDAAEVALELHKVRSAFR